LKTGDRGYAYGDSHYDKGSKYGHQNSAYEQGHHNGMHAFINTIYRNKFAGKGIDGHKKYGYRSHGYGPYGYYSKGYYGTDGY
jgi:hypothetical protein